MTMQVLLDIQEIDYLTNKVLKETDQTSERYSILSKLTGAKGRYQRIMEKED